MKNAKHGALRLALYLHCVGIDPMPVGQSYRQQFAALLALYESLDIATRKNARRLGRQAMRNAGSLEKAAHGLIAETAHPPFIDRKRIAVIIEQMPRKEMFKRIRNGWSRRTPPCVSCRMSNGFPKRSWPSREMAEDVRLRQHDRDTLRVYSCPAMPGFWHLGHLPITQRSEVAISSAPSSSLPDSQ